MADLFLASVGLYAPYGNPQLARVSFQNQIIAETHSEYLLLRLQRRIREGLIKNTDVSVLYVDTLPDGTSTVQHLRLDEDGSLIDEWPGGFFEERYNEMFGR
jgi:predicted ATPase